MIGWLLLTVFAVTARDWPQYRGAGHDGISNDRIIEQWPADGPKVVWRFACASGLSSFVVSGGKAFTQVRRSYPEGQKEACIALQCATGTELWATPVGTRSMTAASATAPRADAECRCGAGLCAFVSSYSALPECGRRG